MRENTYSRLMNLVECLRTCERDISFFADLFGINDEDNAESDREYEAFDDLWDAGSCVSEACSLIDDVAEAYRNGTLKEHNNDEADKEGT